MIIYMKACRKKATCYWCKEPIENKTYMVVGQYYKGKWRIKRNWHPDCWIEQGIDALEHYKTVEKRGGKKLALADEDKKKRFKILARRASVLQRLKKASDTNDVGKMIHL